jgi:hypothetical protein
VVLSIKPLTSSVRLHRRDRWSGKRRRSSLYSMILQGDPVLQTLPWCSSCADTLRDFLHFCSLRLPTWDTEGSINARKWHFPLHRPAPSGSTCSCALFSSLVRSLPHSLPPPPPSFSLPFSLSLSFSLSLLSPALSRSLFHARTHFTVPLHEFSTLLFLDHPLRLQQEILDFVLQPSYVCACVHARVCERVGGRAGGRAR